MNWQDLNNKFSKLSPSEKVLIALCGLVVSVLLIFSVLLEPTLKSITANKLQLQSLE